MNIQNCEKYENIPTDTSDKYVDEPLPAPAPVYKAMPPSSPKFVGYEDYLQMLHDHFILKPTNKLRRAFVLCGVGGVGKTQICLKFAESISNKSVLIILAFKNQIEYK